MSRRLDAAEVLLSAVAATTDEELRAARAAAIETDDVYRALSSPWSPPAGLSAGRSLLGENHLQRSGTVLVERLGRITRRQLADGVGVYLLPPVQRAEAYAARAVADERQPVDAGEVPVPVAIAMTAAAAALLATSAGVVNGATLLAVALLASALRPLIRWASYCDGARR